MCVRFAGTCEASTPARITCGPVCSPQTAQNPCPKPLLRVNSYKGFGHGFRAVWAAKRMAHRREGQSAESTLPTTRAVSFDEVVRLPSKRGGQHMPRAEHLSFSRADLFERCRRAYAFRYLEEAPSFAAPERDFGKAIHAVCERLVNEHVVGQRVG